VNATVRLAAFAVGLDPDAVPAPVVEHAKQCVLDFLGIALRASRDTDSAPAIAAAVFQLAGEGSCTAIGHAHTLPAQYAALLNGAYAHSLDFDDTHARASLHPGAPVIAACLALAETERASGARFLAAVAAGYEIMCRIGIAVDARGHYGRGFHPTATAGVFGATAAGANLLRMSAEELGHAFGINGSQAAGSMQFLENGSWNKRLHPGLAAHNAVVSLAFARAGFVGSAEPLEGRHGFLRGYSDGADPVRLVEGLGETFALLATAFKPYPCCRFNHAAIDLALALRTEHPWISDGVESAVVGLPAKGMDLVAVPEPQKRRPQNSVDAQFSVHYALAASFLWGRFGMDEYGLIRRPDAVALMDRIRAECDPEVDALYPQQLGASLSVRGRGEVLRRVQAIPRGEPENPLSWCDLEAKFRGLTETALTKAAQDRVVAAVRDLERADSLSALTRALGPE
jgi:2-methylcitrate dehydratase PrpD